MKSFGTRLDTETGDELMRAAEFTRLRPADLLRIGARMVLDSIRANGGLVLGGHGRPHPKPAIRRRKPAA